MISNNPLVSVCLITYNHVNFIERAIDSILEQETDFEWDIIIADDNSTDRTRDILLKYKDKYPCKIKLLLQKTNVGAEKNFLQLINYPQSKYIAYLEGDDFWINPYRLQKQVNILEQNPGFSMVYGKNKLVNKDGEYLKYKEPHFKGGFIFNEVLSYKFSPRLPAALMRNKEVKKAYANPFTNGSDYYLMLELTKNTEVAYFDEYLFAYRTNPGSITSTQQAQVFSLFNETLSLYEDEYPQQVKKGRRNGKRMITYLLADKNPSLKYLFLLLTNWNFSALYFRQLIKCLLRCLKLYR